MFDGASRPLESDQLMRQNGSGTGAVVQEHGVNFEYTNIANVQVTLE